MFFFILLMILVTIGWIGWVVMRASVRHQEERDESAGLSWMSPKVFFAHLCIYLLIYAPVGAAFRSQALLLLFWIPVLLLHALVSFAYALFWRDRERQKEKAEYEEHFVDDRREPETIQLADGTVLEVIDEK